ncbi:MAG: glycoside hydrolase family 16 protein [Chitinophagales bacterium]
MKNTTILLFSLILLFGFSGCTEDGELPNRNYQLVWEDNFEGAAGESVNPAKWAFELGRGTDGWGNQELQSYTSSSENVSLDGDGNLAITARSGFTSGRIKTEGLFEQTYGRFEARMKLPWGPGIWPAFWLLGNNCQTEIWPQCGEIDIMEYRGQQPTLVHGSVHGPGYSGGSPVTKTFALENSRFDVDFHIFSIEWGTDYIDYYVDNTLYQRITPDDVSGEWVYDHPFFIVLNIAVGGNYVGFPTDDTDFPQTMLVDWVKVYKEVN